MDFSAANTELWSPVIQIGIISVFILLANVLRRKSTIVRKSMLPTAVIAGFMMLILKTIGIIPTHQADIMNSLTYHGIAIGFIALQLRVNDKIPEGSVKHVGLKSGALIVSTYMIQALTGLIISIVLAYTFMPTLFKASGILLPMGFGQGPGQANNIGITYESLGFAGGQSYGLAIAAAGYLSACIVGVAYLNYLVKSGKVKSTDHEEISGSVTIDEFQSNNEAPISESVDRFSIQVCLVLMVYIIAYGITFGITWLLEQFAPGVASMVSSILWGFNFIIGSAAAILVRVIMSKLREKKIMNHQYQNNYLLNRIAGVAFDVMIVSGIASIDFDDLKGLWIPFVLMVIAGAAVTLFHLKFVCKKLYKDYYYEGLISMYGMMTGTVSSGVLLLRELDPMMATPAATNLVTGSSFAILFGAPFLLLISLAPKSTTMLFIVLGIVLIYYIILVSIIMTPWVKKKTK